MPSLCSFGRVEPCKSLLLAHPALGLAVERQQLECPLEAASIVERLSVRDDHVHERQLEQRPRAAAARAPSRECCCATTTRARSTRATALDENVDVTDVPGFSATPTSSRQSGCATRRIQRPGATSMISTAVRKSPSRARPWSQLLLPLSRARASPAVARTFAALPPATVPRRRCAAAT